MILVTGNPRSGTKSMARMMRAAGYDVRHERSGDDGTSSCFFFLVDRSGGYPTYGPVHVGEKFRLAAYKTRVQTVRDPLACIPSMVKIVGTQHRQWLGANGVVDADIRPKLTWAAHAWIATFEHVQRYVTRRVVRIERVLDDWPEELERPPAALHVHRASGNRVSKPMTARDLWEAAPAVAESILAVRKRLGYK